MEKENKFIVINRKHLSKLPTELLVDFGMMLDKLDDYLPKNKYIVCNEDEPYAEQVWNLILGKEEEPTEDDSLETAYIKVLEKYIPLFSDSSEHELTGKVWQEDEEHIWIRKANGGLARYPKYMIIIGQEISFVD